MKKWIDKFKSLSSTEKGMIIIAFLLIVMVITRFGYITEQVKKGFDFFSQQKNTEQTPKP